MNKLLEWVFEQKRLEDKMRTINTRFGKIIIKEHKDKSYDAIEVWSSIPDNYGGGYSLDGTIIIHDESIGGE